MLVERELGSWPSEWLYALPMAVDMVRLVLNDYPTVGLLPKPIQTIQFLALRENLLQLILRETSYTLKQPQ